MSWALHKGALMGAAGPTHEARDEQGSRGRLWHGRDLPPATCTDLQRGKQQEEEKKKHKLFEYRSAEPWRRGRTPRTSPTLN